MSARRPLAAVYADAADLIDRNGFARGQFYDAADLGVDDYPDLAAAIRRRCSVCAAAAIVLAAADPAAASFDPHDSRIVGGPVRRFADFLIDHGELGPGMHDASCPEDVLEAVAAWSDGCESGGEAAAMLWAAAAEVAPGSVASVVAGDHPDGAVVAVSGVAVDVRRRSHPTRGAWGMFAVVGQGRAGVATEVPVAAFPTVYARDGAVVEPQRHDGVLRPAPVTVVGRVDTRDRLPAVVASSITRPGPEVWEVAR